MSPQRRHRHDEVSAGGVVVRRDPRSSAWETCLIRVRDAWSLPKGNLDRGETPPQAALREISEETGLPLDRLTLLAELPPAEYMYRRDGRLVGKIVHHFLVEAPADAPLRPQLTEVDEARWVPLEEAESKVAYKDLKAAFRAARQHLDAQP